MRIRIFLLLFFLLLAGIVRGQNPDIRLLENINPNYKTAWIRPNQIISDLTFPMTMGLPLAIGIDGFAEKNSLTEQKSLLIFTSIGVAGGITSVTKLLVNRPRPYVTYPGEVFKYGTGGAYSYPSGHTAFAFSLATSISLAYPHWYVIVPAYAWAGAVGFSRMYLGMHYPSDVLSSMVIGSGSALLVHYCARRYFSKHHWQGIPASYFN